MRISITVILKIILLIKIKFLLIIRIRCLHTLKYIIYNLSIISFILRKFCLFQKSKNILEMVKIRYFGNCIQFKINQTKFHLKFILF
jgi:hypothetical protein